jgi:hypothetical protein
MGGSFRDQVLGESENRDQKESRRYSGCLLNIKTHVVQPPLDFAALD